MCLFKEAIQLQEVLIGYETCFRSEVLPVGLNAGKGAFAKGYIQWHLIMALRSSNNNAQSIAIGAMLPNPKIAVGSSRASTSRI